MNRAMLVGNLTKDPELKVTAQTGTSVCTFTVAINRRFAKDGATPGTDFIPVVVWRGQAESSAKYLRKGTKVAVCGSIQTRSYDAKDGTKRYVTEVIADEVQFLNSSRNDSDTSSGGGGEAEDGFGSAAVMSYVEDDLPF